VTAATQGSDRLPEYCSTPLAQLLSHVFAHVTTTSLEVM
jgi:hypothetical protein